MLESIEPITNSMDAELTSTVFFIDVSPESIHFKKSAFYISKTFIYFLVYQKGYLELTKSLNKK